MPRFSLVIPAYNEERLLPRLLDTIEVARGAYGDHAAIEVIVADNRSTDRTAEIARSYGCRVAAVEKRVIAAARNGGARIAGGEILAFIDADSQVHAQTFVDIDKALSNERCIGGATGVTMERWSLGIALTFALFMPMVWLTGMDAGVVFCRRQDFETFGGYDESLLLAEDVAFLWALRKLGKARGQRLLRVTTAKAIASTRKFDEFGDWHYFRFGGELLRYGKTRFADKYWYRPKR